MGRLTGRAGVRGIPEDYTRPTPGLYVRDMRFHTYSKFSPELADAVDLQALLDKLADFLLQSGFAGGGEHSYYDSGLEDPADRSLDALKKAILQALLDGGQFTPEMLEALRGEDNSDGEGES